MQKRNTPDNQTKNWNLYDGSIGMIHRKILWKLLKVIVEIDRYFTHQVRLIGGEEAR